jgi:hypothetical protein
MEEKTWRDMSADERRAARIDHWRNHAVDYASPQAEVDYRARVDRLVAALSMQEPDRVPINLNISLWPITRVGMTPYDAMHDTQRAAEVWCEFMTRFQPDTMVSPLLCPPAPAAMYEALDYRLYAWPGHGVAREAGHQYIEGEWMLAEDYDALIDDPHDFLLRTYLPRTVGAFAGFANMSSLMDFIELPFVPLNVGAWGSPEMVEGLEKLAKAFQALRGWANVMFPMIAKVKGLGFPGYASTGTKAPFDILGDTLRGTKGVVMDMFRCPDKVKLACERLVPVAISWAVKRPGVLDSPVCFMPLHKGADGLMSDAQFHEFYWPTLRAVLIGLIEEGIIPFLFAEGRYGSRLEAIMDLPKGKTVWMFDQTDMARAKQTIGKVACIQGNMPLSLLCIDTPERTADYVRRLIDVAGEGGGFILDIGAVADGGKDENLDAMINTAKEYGVYR